MPKPIKLRDFFAALRAADPSITVMENRGKGSHVVVCKEYPEGDRSFPIPTSSGEVAGPYQSKVISLYNLPKDVFQKGRKGRAKND